MNLKTLAEQTILVNGFMHHGFTFRQNHGVTLEHHSAGPVLIYGHNCLPHSVATYDPVTWNILQLYIPQILKPIAVLMFWLCLVSEMCFSVKVSWANKHVKGLGGVLWPMLHRVQLISCVTVTPFLKSENDSWMAGRWKMKAVMAPYMEVCGGIQK